MPRTAREKGNSGTYHIMLRGINRQTIFKDDEDADTFLQTLKNYKDESGYKVYAYCLMGNHIHLLIHEGKEELAIVMRRIGASYVYWYNWKYKRCGHLFQDRYKSEAVDNDQYFMTVLRYIHQNPLKAGLVKKLTDYSWSSFTEFTGKNIITDTDDVLGMFDDNREKAAAAFKKFHAIDNDDICLDIEGNKRLRDDEAAEVIQRICGVSRCLDVQMLEADRRNEYLKHMKAEGLSTRQIARLTGISRAAVLKA